MANCILAFPNRVDATHYPVTFGGGAWEEALPLGNLASPLLARVARSVDAQPSSTWFTVDLGAQRDIMVVAIPRHNLSRAARVRVTAAADAGFETPVVQLGWVDVWPVVFPWASLPWGAASFWDGKLDPEAAEGYAMPFVTTFPRPVAARFWKVEIDDSANAAGFVELARLVLAPGWQPSLNMAVGATLGYADESPVERSLGGAVFVDSRPRRRVARFTIHGIPLDEALAWPLEMQRLLGIGAQVFFVSDPADTVHLHRRSMLATLRTLSPLEYLAGGRNAALFELEEVIA